MLTHPPQAKILILPGWKNSGPQHWQSHWEKKIPGAVRIAQDDWFDPDPMSWVHNIDQTVNKIKEPIIFVAHSLGCIALVAWASRKHSHVKSNQILGALLVAPADVERSNAPACLSRFAPVADAQLDFPSLIVASNSDPYCATDKVRQLAIRWGSRFLSIGDAGHINIDSGHTQWEQGFSLLSDCIESNGSAAGYRIDTQDDYFSAPHYHQVKFIPPLRNPFGFSFQTA